MDLLDGAKREILNLQAERNFRSGNFRSALGEYQKLFEMMLNSGDERSIATYDEKLGDCYDHLDHQGHKERIEDHKKAAEHFIKSADRFRKLRDHERAGLVYEKGANALEEMDLFKEAGEFYRESARMFGEVKDFVNASYSFHRAAEYYERDGEFDLAAMAYQESAVCDMKIKDTGSASTSFKRAAMNYEKLKAWGKAVDTYAASVGIDTANRQYLDVAETYERIAHCQFELNDYKTAIYYHLKSADLRFTNDDKNNAALNYREIGIIYESMKEYDQAVKYFVKSAGIYFSANNQFQEGASFYRAGGACEAKGDFEEAGRNYVDSGKSYRGADNEGMSKDSFTKAAEAYLKASEAEGETRKGADLRMNAALSYSEIKDYAKAADSYNAYAKVLDDLGETQLAEEGYKLAAQEYVKGGRIWEAAEAYVNHNDYQSAAELYDRFSEARLHEKDNYGAALGFMEGGNCHRRLMKDGPMKGHLDRAINYFTKAVDELRLKEKTPQNLTLLGDAYRKMGECNQALWEMTLALSHFKKAQEYYAASDDEHRRTLVDAFELKVEAIKALDHGYYPQAEELLVKSQKLFDLAVAGRHWNKEYTKILDEHSKDCAEMVEKIKLKPEIVLDIDRYSYTFSDIPVILNLTLTNNGQYTMKQITYLEHLPDHIRLTRLPDNIPEVASGTMAASSIEILPTKCGLFIMKPIEVYYEDQKGHKYVKASNEMSIEVVERPPTDYKNYLKALEVFQRYAKSQENNKNWFQAGDGYREMAETYGRFRNDETLIGYYLKSVENYARYAEESRGHAETDNKALVKRLGDAHWFKAEGLRNAGRMDEAVKAYGDSIPPYRSCRMDHMANRSTAFMLKMDGVKSIRTGDYAKAKTVLEEALRYFNSVIKAGGYDEDGLNFLKKNEDEAASMLSTIKGKPEIAVSVTGPQTMKEGETVSYSAQIRNPLDYPVKMVRPVMKTVEGVEIIENAPFVGEIKAGESATVGFRLKVVRSGSYRFGPLDITYTDDKGNAFMRGSNEITMDSTGLPPQEPAPAPDVPEDVRKARLKPDIELDVDGYSYTFSDIPVILNLKLSNNGGYNVREVSFMEHLPDEIKLLKLPEGMAEVGSGDERAMSIELKPQKPGVYTMRPIEVYYKDLKGHNFVKASNEMTLEVSERPPTDYKNYAKAVDLFRKYAESQEANRSWFQAGDGYREMAETYGRFRSDDTVTEYHLKSVENFRRYVEENRGRGAESDKTQAKRLADAIWFSAEGLRNAGRLEEAVGDYEESAAAYESCGMLELAKRSNALKRKVEGIRLIRSGDYPAAEASLNDAIALFDAVIKAGGFDEAGLKYLEKNDDEAKSLIGDIHGRTEIEVSVESPREATAGEPITMEASIRNPLAAPITQVRPLVRPPEGVELVENPREVREIPPGGSAKFGFIVKVARPGTHRFSMFEVSYVDSKGKTFKVGSREVGVEVRPRAQETPKAPFKESAGEGDADGADGKPTLTLDFGGVVYAKKGEETDISGRLINEGAVGVTGIRFIGNNSDALEVLEPPEGVDSLAPGASAQVKAKIRLSSDAMFTANMMEFFYKDMKGRRYFKSSNPSTFRTSLAEAKEQPAQPTPYGFESSGNIREKLEARMKGMPDNTVILISSKSESHGQVVSEALRSLVNERGMGGVYLSFTQPYDAITSTIKSMGTSTDDIYFIDCISRTAGKPPHEKTENAVFVENPSSLEEVSMYLDRMLAKVESKKKFLFLDSLSSLLIYNTDKTVKEFTHFLINKIRLDGIAGIILSIEKKEAEDLVKTLTPMCDAEIRV
jgi:tetratricopeptide (TPR) repeat protein